MAATVPNRSRRNAWGIASLDIFSINEVLRQIQLAVDGLQVTEHEHTGTEAAESGEPDELQIVESSITPPILTSNKHNWNPSGLATATVIRVSATTPVNITGLAAQPNGTIKKFFNYGTIDITLKDNSDNSRRVNRFDLTADTVIGANETVSIQYDASSNRHRWKVIGNAGGSSAGGSLADGDKGDITVSGSGATWTIDNDAVTYAKMQNVSAASKLLGRGDGGSGDPEEITLGSNLSISGTTISATSGVTDHGALTGLTDDDHDTLYPLITNFEADRATIATRWDDLTDGGETTLHSHAGGGAEQKTPPFVDGADITALWEYPGIGNGYIYVDINGGGSAITTGVKGDLYIPFDMTLTHVIMLGDQSGSIVVDIWNDTIANHPPTVADTITASDKPTISAAVSSQDNNISTWTTSINGGTVLRFNVDSVTALTRLHMMIGFNRRDIP